MKEKTAANALKSGDHVAAFSRGLSDAAEYTQNKNLPKRGKFAIKMIFHFPPYEGYELSK